MGSESPCRWGILSTAGIARKNWMGIRDSGNGRVVAVASRDLERASAFIADCQSEAPFEPAPEPVGSYDELLARDDIDAVYIPLPTALRKSWVISAASAGKSVLCEKPCAPSAADLGEMIDACRSAGVQFMDGVMFMHSARLPALRAALDGPDGVGTIRRITTHFSFNASENFLGNDIRVSSELEPYGCLGDLGWYCIRFTLWTLNYAMPEAVRGQLLTSAARPDSAAPVPTQFSADMRFPNGVTASFYCSFMTTLQELAVVSGTDGYLQLNDFVLPFVGGEPAFVTYQSKLNASGCVLDVVPQEVRHAVREPSNGSPGSQEANMFNKCAELTLAGTPDAQWEDVAMKTQQVMDACWYSAQAGMEVRLERAS